MQFIEPKISFICFLYSLVKPKKNKLSQNISQKYISQYTDSGASSFAYIIESLNLRGKQILLPAYLCDIFTPILIAYDIDAVFLDIDKKTFQPPLSEYQKHLSGKTSAILLVPVYGQDIPTDVQNFLSEKKKQLILDLSQYIHFNKIPLQCQPDAIFLSLSKKYPILSGGQVFLQKNKYSKKPIKQKNVPFTRLFHFKNLVKLFPISSYILEKIKQVSHRKHTSPTSYRGIKQLDILSRKLIYSYIDKKSNKKFCTPIMVQNSDDIKHIFHKKNIFARRIWHNPIIQNEQIQRRYNIKPSSFPHTQYVSKHILCIPPHVSEQDIKSYLK